MVAVFVLYPAFILPDCKGQEEAFYRRGIIMFPEKIRGVTFCNTFCNISVGCMTEFFD
jgi:hypothetical protein